MPNSKLFFIALLSCVFISSCKKPESDFRLERYEYSAGDAIEVENLSVNDKICKWEILNAQGDSMQQFEGRNPVMAIGILLEDGAYTLRLSSYNNREKKKSTSEKTFLVKSLRGTLVVNNSGAGSSGHKQFDVYVDNQYIGKSNASGQFAKEIPVGLRWVELIAPNARYEYLHEIQFNDSEYISF